MKKRWIYGAANPSGVKVLKVNGIRLVLDLGAPMHRFIYETGKFESELTKAISDVVLPGDVFVDIGANFGWHTLHLLASRPDVTCGYAYEPSAKMFALLERSVAVNNLSSR